MGKSRGLQIIIVLAALVVLTALLLPQRTSRTSVPQNPSPAAPAELQRTNSVHTAARQIPEPTPEQEAASDPFTLSISREKVEEYLKKHHRDAASLLAAFHAMVDTNLTHDVSYLREAATN